MAFCGVFLHKCHPMSYTDPVDRLLIERFFRGECTPAESRRVREWLADPRNEAAARAWMADIWQDLDSYKLKDAAAPDFGKMLQNIQDRTQPAHYPEEAGPAAGPESYPRRRSTSGLPLVWRIAAGLLLLLVAGGLLYWLPRRAEEAKTAASTPASALEAPGKVKKLTLSDGTIVWLNARSRLVYPASFEGKGTREVKLEGEAYFDVAENKQQPFIVATSGIRIKVLGTAFNVRSYGTDSTIETTLVRGRVVLEKTTGRDSRQVTMRPNQKAVFTRQTGLIALDEVNPDLYTAWQSGTLSFEDEPMENALEALERWYGVRIHAADQNAYKTCRLTARIDRESLQETLELLKATTHIEYSLSGEDVYLTGGSCD
jgi:ferric-dicitrate binding protein FerR (iron transport regulator)